VRTKGLEATGTSWRGEGADQVAPTLAGEDRTTFGAGFGPGDAIGRYIVEKTLGAGGMGVVLAARDPKLDRPVAIKVIHRRETDARESSARLVREAQALARVSDPHVVPVYDVGMVEGRVFVAMELVAGRTLRAWLRDGPHPWTEVVEVMRQAGRGLLAVHGTGLVHRDFKPENVLVEEHGSRLRVRVMDFGLARHGGLVDDKASDSFVNGDSLTATLTRTGSVMGTPVYMSPEQHVGRRVDFGSDQFSFCVTVYEALHGVRPFAGDSAAKLSSNKRKGILTDPAKAERLPPRPVPSWLHDVVVRGLHPDPSKRWPSMLELLSAMDPRRRRRRVRGLTIGGFVLGGAVLAWPSSARDEHACTKAGHKLYEVWNEARATTIERAFESADAPHAHITYQRAHAGIDAHAQAWARAHVDLCRMLELEERSTLGSFDRAFDRAFACLERRRVEFDSLLVVLAAADRTTLDHAAGAITSLASPASCLDGTDDDLMPPPAIADEVAHLRAKLSEAKMLHYAGTPLAALEAVQPILDRALALEFDPLIAETRMHLGWLCSQLGRWEEAEVLLTDAIATAEALGMDRTAADATTYLVFLLANHQERCSEAMRWARHARARLDRGPSVIDAEARLLENSASCLELDDPHSAVEALEQALELRHRQGDEPAIAMAMNALGGVLRRMGRFDDALEIHRRSLDIRSRVLGTGHPETAMSFANIATVMADLGRVEEALEHAEAAYAPFENALGHAHPLVATSLEIVANLHYRQGRYEQSVDLYRRVLALRTETWSEDHPKLAIAWANLGAILTAVGRTQEAREALLNAARISTTRETPEDAAGIYYNLGMLALQEGEEAHAEQHFERAHALWLSKFGPDHPNVAYALSLLGRVALRRGDAHRALPLLEQAHTIRNAHGIEGTLRVEEFFDLARALLETGAVGTRHIELARAAREGVAAFVDVEPELHARIDRWLELHDRDARGRARRSTKVPSRP
jgi:eukaryotic-like serine/threonine-protein kinase